MSFTNITEQVEPSPKADELVRAVSNHQTPMAPLDLVEEQRPRAKLRIWAILIALYLALFVAALDQTIIATSIPTISAQLHSAAGYFWIGGAYLLANAAAAPIWAKCSDIWGRKPALLGAVALFAIASIIAATSVSMTMLIAARALQGTAGGGLLQLVTITISDLFSMRRRTLYLGLLEVMWAVAGGAGPLIGGAFTQLVSWRWCFWINLPVSGVTFLLLFLFLDVHNPRTRLREGLAAIDWLGTLSVLAVTLMLLLGLDFGGTVFPWSSAKVICLIVFGTLMIGFFIFSEKRLAKYPLMPLDMFKDMSNIALFLVGFSQGMVFIAAEYYLPLYLQSVKQASPLRSGVLILPITVSEAVIGIACGVIMHQTGRYKEIIVVGAALTALGTGLYISFDRSTPIARLVGFEIIGGSGCGMLFEAPIIALQNAVTQADTATATATYGFLRNIATSMSIVIGGVIFQNGMDMRASALKGAGLASDLVEAFSGGEAAASVELVGTIENAARRRAAEDAFAWSLRNMWIFFTAIAGVGVLAAFFVRQKDLSKEHTETKTGIEQMTRREAPS
ncbi:putative MFS transporter [Hortaea werneckii]|nr:putative MFS transporter [Hortaea werneckii]